MPVMSAVMRAIFTCALTLVLAGPAVALADMARYNVDAEHSTVEFRVAHMVVSKTAGRFTDYAGFIEMDPAAQAVKAIEATIKTASITTHHPKRDAHLKGPDFFNVEAHPTIVYKLKSYRKTGDDYTAVGDLTMLGVTREITLVGRFHGEAKDPWGNLRAGFSAEGKLNRKDFGMNWSKTLDNGGLVVGDDVFIRLDIECIKSQAR